MMNFLYKLTNAEHLSAEQRAEIQQALDMQAYICQQEFEQALDKYHQINVIMEADGEAVVTLIEIDDEDAYVELDCSRVIVDE